MSNGKASWISGRISKLPLHDPRKAAVADVKGDRKNYLANLLRNRILLSPQE